MRTRLWPAVAMFFGGLLVLLPLFAWLVFNEVERIHKHTMTARQTYHKADDAISNIQANINKGALIELNNLRSPDIATAQRGLASLRQSTQSDSTILMDLLGARQKSQILALQHGLDEYWSAIEQSLTTPRTQEQQLFIELEKQPGTLLELAGHIDGLNQERLAREERDIEGQQSSLERFAIAATIILLLLECAIGVFSTAYMARLDRVSEGERVRAEKAEVELRRLSNQLVRVQEEERKTISRELHDEVGQLLTGLRMELGTLSPNGSSEEFRTRLESIKRLAEDSLRSVRNLALLVRPSMLDDLGLEPALHWQAKEFSRRCGIPVSVNIEGTLANLPEALRLCLYRAIQEAMTNCGKHAEASRVTVIVQQDAYRVIASIHDNGRGFDPQLQTQGLGLLGMTERVRALQGRMSVASEPGSGTMIRLELPVNPDSDPDA